MQTLNGTWKLKTDRDNKGRAERWFDVISSEAEAAPVPGPIQQVFRGYHGVAWDWHTFELAEASAPGERVLFQFGAVDYLAEVWLNGRLAGSFEGGETPFELDITELAHTKASSDNLLAVRVLNPTDEPIDGVVLSEIPHRNKVSIARPGSSCNSGGIIYPASGRRVPGGRDVGTLAPPPRQRGDRKPHTPRCNPYHGRGGDRGPSAP